MPAIHDQYTSFSLRPDVVATVLDDGAVLLDLQTKYFYSANAGAWGMIQMFETGATVQQVMDQCYKWGANAEDASAINAVLESLRREQLLESNLQSGSAATISGLRWSRPILEKHREPLQKIMVSAFDPSIPLAE